MKICRAFRLSMIGSFALSWTVHVPLARAATGDDATLTGIVNSIELQSPGCARRFAAMSDTVPDGTAIRTLPGSRAELTFADQTLLRLSANASLALRSRARRALDLGEGAALLQTPKGARHRKVTAGNVAAAVNGATIIVEYRAHTYLKLISLEGTTRLYLPHRWGESILVGPGQMVITSPDARHLPNPVEVDLQRLMTTSRLIVDFPPLGSRDRIASESAKQQRAKSKQSVLDTNLVIFGKGTLVSLTNPATVAAPPAAPNEERSSIPASTDLGQIEFRNPDSTSNGSAVASDADDTAR